MPLKPQEYYYLYSPRRAVPEEMFKYTVESLVLEGHLNYYYKAIYIHSNADRKRNRLFLCLGKSYNPKHNYSVAERFVLSLFEEQQELRPYEIRLKALDKLNDNIDEFRTLYVYQDIQTLGYCWLRIFLTSAGRKAKKDYARLIETLENNTNTLLKTPDVLQAHLKALGTGIVLVDDAAIKTLKLTVPNLKEIAAVFEIITSSGGSTYGSSGGFYGGGGGGYSGGGSWGGFGGGMGGGGGSGGSW